MPGCFSCFGGTTRLDGAEDRSRAVPSQQQLPQAHGAAFRRQHGSDAQGACSHPSQSSTIPPLYKDSSQTFKLDGHHPGAGASIATQDATGEKALGLGAGLADHSMRHASADHRAHVTETATSGGLYLEQSGSLQLGSARAGSQGLAGTGSLQSASNTGGTSFDTDKSPHNSLVQASIELLDDGVIMPGIGELALLSRNAGGVVYYGRWRQVPVAVKLIVSTMQSDLLLAARETLLSKLAGHPNLVQTFAVGCFQLTASHFVGMRQAAGKEEPALASLNARSQASHGNLHGANSNPDAHEGKEMSVHGLSRDTSTSAGRAGQGTRDGASCGVGEPAVHELHNGLRSPAEVLLSLGASPGHYLTQVVMEYVDADSLLAAIKRGDFQSAQSRWWLRALLATAVEVALGMGHLHDQGLVHGDLKPQNVLLRTSRRDKRGFCAKVSDFGLAHWCRDGSQENCRQGDSVVYAAPEVFTGSLSKASDVWAYGVMLWQICTGLQPYEGVKREQVANGIISNKLSLIWPAELASRGDYRPLAKLVTLCTDRTPEGRPSFRQIAKALDKLQQSLRSRGASAVSAQRGGAGLAAGQQQPMQPQNAAGTSQLHGQQRAGPSQQR